MSNMTDMTSDQACSAQLSSGHRPGHCHSWTADPMFTISAAACCHTVSGPMSISWPVLLRPAPHVPDTMFFVLMDSTGLIRARVLQRFTSVSGGCRPDSLATLASLRRPGPSLGLTLSFHSDHRTGYCTAIIISCSKTVIKLKLDLILQLDHP